AVDNLNVNTATGALNATSTGILTIVTHTLGLAQSIDLGGADAAGVLGITSAEINRMTADRIRIGDANSGPISISAAIAPTGPTILHLRSGAGVSEVAAAGTITETNLAVEAAGNVSLGEANDVDVLAIQVAGAPFNLMFQDTDDLQFGTVDGVVGIANL